MNVLRVERPASAAIPTIGFDADSHRFSNVYARSIQPDAGADYELRIDITAMREVSAATRNALRAVVPNAAILTGRASIEIACQLVDLRAGIVERTATSQGTSDFGATLFHQTSGADTSDAAARRLLPNLLLRCADLPAWERAR